MSFAPLLFLLPLYFYLILELQVCDVPVDVAFVMDSSASIGNTDYKKEKDLVKLLAKSFDISPSHSRVAIVLNSGSAFLGVSFDQYSNHAAFTSAVDKLPYKKGRKRVDKALEVANNELFVKARTKAVKLAVVIISGRQIQELNLKDLKRASERLRTAGVRILAVGIGDVDPAELRLMTESYSDVFLAKSFEDLMPIVPELAQSACVIPGTYNVL